MRVDIRRKRRSKRQGFAIITDHADSHRLTDRRKRVHSIFQLTDGIHEDAGFSCWVDGFQQR